MERPRSTRERAPRAASFALAALASVASLSIASVARAGSPPEGPADLADPLDLFLDRARGDRVTEEPRAGSFEVGATGSLTLSSWAAPSFGVLGFVQMPLDRLFEGRRRELTEVVLAAGAGKLPPANAGVPVTDRAARSQRSAPSNRDDRGPSPQPSHASTPSAGAASSRAAAPASAASTPRTASPASAVSLPRAASPSSGAAGSGGGTTGAALGTKPSGYGAARDVGEEPELDAAEDDAEDAGAAQPEGQDAAAPPRALTPELARGAVRVACTAARLDEAEARLDSLASRAKTSALLPELRLRATRAIDESEALSPTEYDPTRRTASGSATTWLEARATFRLDRLVFADDELAVERQRMARAAERSRIVERVLDLLDTWQRARAAAEDPQADPSARARADLAVAASEASLDVMTDGWFSKAIVATTNPAKSNDVGAASGATSAARVTPSAATSDAPHPSTSRVTAPVRRSENGLN
ncbi:MAG: hypothetical protein U0441_00770 [Polyangiaceae bacterium]